MQGLSMVPYHGTEVARVKFYSV